MLRLTASKLQQLDEVENLDAADPLRLLLFHLVLLVDYDYLGMRVLTAPASIAVTHDSALSLGECLQIVDEALNRVAPKRRHDHAIKFQKIIMQSADYSRKVFCLDWIRQHDIESKL